MIDDKKIEGAKDSIFNKNFLKNNEGMICIDHISEPVYLDYQIKEAIGLGAKWAINELLKDLWHPASEDPKTYKRLIEKCYLDRVRYHDTMFLGTISWDKKVESDGIICWLYIDDLFPKEGGEQ